MGKKGYVEATYYSAEFRQMFRAWLEERGMTYDWEHCDLFAQDPEMLEFKYEKNKAYYAELYAHMSWGRRREKSWGPYKERQQLFG